MRIWHQELLRYLPDLQFRGQLRELILIKRAWERQGTPNHLLVNKVTAYPKDHLATYFNTYATIYYERYNKHIQQKYVDEFTAFGEIVQDTLFEGWHDEGYLKICMTNLYEKHAYAEGKSRITDEEWSRLLLGYHQITGTAYNC